jgi:hypothetical protein
VSPWSWDFTFNSLRRMLVYHNRRRCSRTDGAFGHASKLKTPKRKAAKRSRGRMDTMRLQLLSALGIGGAGLLVESASCC